MPPMDTALKTYIAKALTTLSKEQLSQALTRTGWPERTVKKYLEQEPALPATNAPTIITLTNVNAQYGTKKVLKNVNITVTEGELLGIIGTTGAGKTTLLHIIAGILPNTSGTVIINKPIGIAPQRPALHDHLTVEENLQHAAQLYNFQEPESRIKELLKLTNTESEKETLVEHLSPGMKKRVDIACALIHQPALLILDEPLADIDPTAREHLWHLLHEINKKKTTILITSHLVDELSHHCTRITALKGGALINLGTREELSAVYAQHYEVRLTASPEHSQQLLKSIPQELQATPFERDDTMIITTQHPNELIAHLATESAKQRIPIISLTLQKPSLSEVFEDIVT